MINIDILLKIRIFSWVSQKVFFVINFSFCIILKISLDLEIVLKYQSIIMTAEIVDIHFHWKTSFNACYHVKITLWTKMFLKTDCTYIAGVNLQTFHFFHFLILTAILLARLKSCNLGVLNNNKIVLFQEACF